MKGSREFTAVLGCPGYQVYRHAIDEEKKHLTLWVRRKRGNRKLTCPSCGRVWQRLPNRLAPEMKKTGVNGRSAR